MRHIITVRDIDFDCISGYFNNFIDDRGCGRDFYLSHTPLLILHYFPDLKVNEEVLVNGETFLVKPKSYDYNYLPFRVKDFYLYRTTQK